MAKQSLNIFMHSLPKGSKFNICGFRTNYEFLFNEIVVDYTEETLKKHFKILKHTILEVDA